MPAVFHTIYLLLTWSAHQLACMMGPSTIVVQSTFRSLLGLLFPFGVQLYVYVKVVHIPFTKGAPAGWFSITL